MAKLPERLLYNIPEKFVTYAAPVFITIFVLSGTDSVIDAAADSNEFLKHNPTPISFWDNLKNESTIRAFEHGIAEAVLAGQIGEAQEISQNGQFNTARNMSRKYFREQLQREEIAMVNRGYLPSDQVRLILGITSGLAAIQSIVIRSIYTRLKRP